MAESKGSLLAKSVQKHAGRAKEKVGTADTQTYMVYTYKRTAHTSHKAKITMNGTGTLQKCHRTDSTISDQIMIYIYE